MKGGAGQMKRAACLALTALFARGSTTMAATEEARYTVEQQDGPVEVRRYAPQVVAEVRIDGRMEDAGNKAFQPLFRYISGNNRAKAKIAMTSPVGQEKAPGEKITMTAPVGQQAANGAWAVTFMMPARYNLDTLPEPLDERVRLREVPGRRMAAIRYSGRWTRRRYDLHLAKLRKWLEEQGLVASGEPVWARYNPPFTPSFLRRNEILIPLRDE